MGLADVLHFRFGVAALVARYPSSRGYIFAVRAGVRKVASADNRSICIAHARNLLRDSQAKSSGLSSNGASFAGIKKIALTLIYHFGSTFTWYYLFSM